MMSIHDLNARFGLGTGEKLPGESAGKLENSEIIKYIDQRMQEIKSQRTADAVDVGDRPR